VLKFSYEHSGLNENDLMDIKKVALREEEELMNGTRKLRTVSEGAK
jgi:hypothetical protein